MIHVIGYIASALLALSLVISNALKFRWLNLGGNITFIIYGVFINALPVIIANSILLCINIFQIVKLFTVKEIFELVEINANDELITKFLKFYGNDIQLFFPDFVVANLQNKKHISFVVLRNLSIANIFIAEIDTNGNAMVKINYTVPKYRDYKVGKFIFEREHDYLIQHQIKRIVYEKMHNKNHIKFLEKMGFNYSEESKVSCFTKQITNAKM